jgi:tetratricopeptide (TPR) repeat protein
MNASTTTLTPSQQRLWQQAEVHAATKNWKQAIACFQELRSERPDDAAIPLQLSYLESLAGRYRAARTYAIEAQKLQPSDPTVLCELLARLRTFNAFEAFNECLNRMGPLDRVPIPLLLAAAAQCSYLNDHGRALLILDEARRADPDFPPTLVARAQVLMYLGKFGEAEAEVSRSQRRAPEIPQGWSVLSKLRRQTTAHNHVAQIRAQMRRPGRRPQEIAMLAEALHKELDELGDYPAAWSALAQMCQAKRSTLEYTAAASHGLFASLLSLPVANSSDDGADASRVPIFIVGMHRSGTTLLEQLLDGHPEMHGVGELYDFTSQMRYATDHHCRGVIDLTIVERSKDVDFAAVGEGYLKGMEWRLGKERFFTDKLPSNFLNIGFICQALPQAKILHMVRDPIETCFSNLRELFSDANPYSYDQLELADFYKQYRRLMAHWHQAYPGRILDVDYAELTRDTETVLRRVSAFCGFEFEPEMLALQNRKRGVATASAVQVRDKVVVREQPKWKPYEQYLQPLIQALRADGFVQ